MKMVRKRTYAGPGAPAGPTEITVLGYVKDPANSDNRRDDWAVYYETNQYAPKTSRRWFVDDYFYPKPEKWEVGKKYKTTHIEDVITVLSVDDGFAWAKAADTHFTMLPEDRKRYREVE